MKKLYLIVTLVFLLSSMTFGDVVGDTESMTPAEVTVFIKTRHIGRLLKTANYLVYNLMEDEQREKIISEKNAFRDKTGVDYLDEESLKNFGIDTSRPVSFAMFDKDNQREVMAVFIPVTDEKEFVNKFIEIKKKTLPEQGDNPVSPVSATHKGIEITQLENDMYVAGIAGYFLIGSTDDIVRKIIDVREARNGNLMLTPEYKDYSARGRNNYDVNAFITGKFIEQINSAPRGDAYGAVIKDLILVQGGDSAGEDFDSNSLINSVEYITAGMGFDRNKFQLNSSVKLAGDNPYVEMILGLLKIGENGKSLYVQNADSTVFLALNYKYLDNLCKSGMPMCAQYNQFKSDLKTQGKIDFEADILPYYSGVINAFSIDSGAAGGMGDMAVFLPINDEKKVAEIWKKFRAMLQAKYGKEKKFGEEKIDGKRAFWYIDQTQMRFFVAYDSRGIYAGNSTGLIKAALKSDTMDKAKNAGRIRTILNDKTFFLFNIKKNNFIRNLLMMRAQGTPGIGSGLSRVGEVSLFCEKRDRLVSVDLDIEIKERMKKGK